jgi:hypothetical protein
MTAVKASEMNETKMNIGFMVALAEQSGCRARSEKMRDYAGLLGIHHARLASTCPI